MLEELQQLVDGLSETLRRSITIEDREQRLCVYSAQATDVDRARVETILNRGVPAPFKEWVLGLGVAEATGPVIAPANRELATDRRLCVPLRHDGRLTGYLWIVDADATLGDAELARAPPVAEAAARVMYRDELADRLARDRDRERELVRRLLGGHADLRAHAAAAVVNEQLLQRADTLCAVVVRPSAPAPPSEAATVLEQVSERLRRLLPPRLSVGLARYDHAVVLVAASTPAELARQAAQAVAFAREASGGEQPYAAGVSAPVGGLRLAHRAYEQALVAAQVAAAIEEVGPVADWEALGVYRLLAPFATREVRAELSSGPLRRLVAADRTGALVETLETYLDSGCDVQATATSLFLHRASLYGRLNRIQEILGESLRDGQLRLELHLSLKLARLSDPNLLAPPDDEHD